MRPLYALWVGLFMLSSTNGAGLAAINSSTFYPGRVEHQAQPYNVQNINLSAETLKQNLDDVRRALTNLQKTIRAIVCTAGAEGNVSVDQPNVFGSVVKIGIPPPTGTIALRGYGRPSTGYAPFFANEVRKRMAVLANKSNELPTSVLTRPVLSSHLSKIRQDINYLETEDKKIQRIASSVGNDSIGNLAVGKEVLDMRDTTDEIKNEIKQCKNLLNGFDESTQLSALKYSTL